MQHRSEMAPSIIYCWLIEVARRIHNKGQNRKFSLPPPQETGAQGTQLNWAFNTAKMLLFETLLLYFASKEIKRFRTYHGFFITIRNEVAKVMFLRVSVCPQGGVPGQVHPWTRCTPQTRYTACGTRYTPPDQVHPPGPGTSWDQVHPPDQVHPLGLGTPPWTRYTPQTRCTPGTRYTPLKPGTPPWNQVHPLDQVPPWDQVHHPQTRYTPWPGTDPPDQVHPPGTRYLGDGWCCIWYTSYWNAFLFIVYCQQLA